MILMNFYLKAEDEVVPREVLQDETTDDHYFKLLVDKRDGEYYERVYRVDIYDKNTNALTQQIDVDCRYWGAGSLMVFDYNFDGVDDFSIFEDSYAGPNTSRLYILRNPETNSYFVSDISGVSLEFDSSTKTIFERNQCCAGSIVTTATYKIENNEMVLIEEHCFRWDEEKNDLVERPIEECR